MWLFVGSIAVKLCADRAAIYGLEGACLNILGAPTTAARASSATHRTRARALIADSSRAGLHSDYELTILLVFTTLIMLLVTLIAIVWQARSVATQPTLRLCATGAQPELTLARGCRYHTFVSHVWGTGQDQVHTLVRQLQLLLPGVRVWLDVDSLTNVGALEESIRQSQTVIIFLSEGYFASRNCRHAPRSRRDCAEILDQMR